MGRHLADSVDSITLGTQCAGRAHGRLCNILSDEKSSWTSSLAQNYDVILFLSQFLFCCCDKLL